jgi:thiosulfate/3-mercaptopyruvate sulfurtransferase
MMLLVVGVVGQACLTGLAVQTAGPQGKGVVKWVSTEWLQDHLKDANLRILDTQPNVHEYFIDMNQVKKLVGQSNVILLDTRPAKFYEGQGPWIKPGHIPGAVSLPWRSLMADDNPTRLKPDAEIALILKEHNITPDKTILCSCGTGREATNEFLLFKWYLGYPNVKLYEGSFTEWSAYPDNPTVVGPNPK